MEAIGQLAGGVAHDLNNILTPILVSAALLQERMKGPEEEHLLAVLVASAQRGADIVRQLLWFGRGLEGKRILLNPKHVIQDVTRGQRPNPIASVMQPCMSAESQILTSAFIVFLAACQPHPGPFSIRPRVSKISTLASPAATLPSSTD